MHITKKRNWLWNIMKNNIQKMFRSLIERKLPVAYPVENSEKCTMNVDKKFFQIME